MSTSTASVPTTAAAAPRFPLGSLLLLSLAVFVTVTAESLPAGLLPEMVEGLRTDPLGVGLLISVWAVTVIVTSIPLARLTARFDRRLVAAGSLAAFAVANAATALAPTYEVAVATRVAAGVAHGLFWAIVIVYATSLLAPSHLGRGLALVTAGGTVATLAGLPAGALIAQLLSWRWSFGVLAVAALALAIVIALRLPRRAPAAAMPRAERPTGADASLAPILLFAAAALVFALGQFATFTYVRPLLEVSAGAPEAQVPILLFGYGAAGLVGVAVAGPLADRWPRGSLVAVLAGLAAAFGILTLAADTPLMYVALAAWGFAIGVYFPLQQSLLMRIATDRTRTLASAGVVVTFNVGIAVGPWLGDLVGGAAAPAGATALSGGAVVVALLLVVAAVGAARRPVRDRDGSAATRR
ncbi:MFS transporter [Microbacterium sp. EYE_5]|uniref:MFS transporter n=1 Tax=unclassified Microbacterium TaxID=2609290 RepID=UPI002004205B|nr:MULTISPECIES: MFS transporter [unclassified Microbacterium]MCK6079239.1 MFS transporter [Microbacterium sp. EYE_382]MCK6084509.1 MFS transporter [Microbacterium sp. EYE_384]MCK6123262.1 MFS transporter [Microbacterium sp. EYE_80]MCK6125273.1 MFS transporter [Microbacterium sp. EYE_79]MCK6140193.1 MFS transporter [Microbacterium sp. EYE_39]